MKILLLRANEKRHIALGRRLAMSGNYVTELIEKVQPASENTALTTLQKLHFKARSQVEEDFFPDIEADSEAVRLEVPHRTLNTPFFYDLVENIDFDLAITFGVSILSKETIQKLRDRILGVHLGLSPYYRGSGTNFFPFVNRELGAIGYTFMHLDEGVDTGRIIHQGRAPIVLGDSIHTIGNRNIEYLIRDICTLSKTGIDFESAVGVGHSEGKLYKKRDFTEDALSLALQNLKDGLVESTLHDLDSEMERFPLVRRLGIHGA